MSPSTRRIVAAFVASVALIVGVGVFASSSVAAPYTAQPTLSVNTQTPAAGGSLTLTGSGFGANETIDNTLHTATYTLASAHADASGSFSVVVTLPAGVTGSHTIVSTGMTSGKSASISITIGATPISGSSGGGGLASTGVAVLGVGALGVVLLAGGGVMLLSGRRRKVRA